MTVGTALPEGITTPRALPGSGDTVDVLVLGGGLSGLATAARAASLGLRVLVVEKLDRIGGSAALSAGILWTAPDVETFARIAPDGDPTRGRLLVEGFEPAVAALKDAGVEVSERWHGQMGFGVAYHVEIAELLEHYHRAVVRAGGRVLTSTAADILLRNPTGDVCGAILRGPEGVLRVTAAATVLATGGFQGDPELVQRLIGFDADRMLLRSNPGSVGDGVRLATAAGAGMSHCLGSFYGHLVPDGVAAWSPSGYLPLTQYHSRASIVVNTAGRRFTDETLGDETTNQAALRQPGGRVFLLADARVRREHATGRPYPHGQIVDRFQHAIDAGGRVLVAETWDELLDGVARWGVDRASLAKTVADYAAAATGADVALDAPVTGTPARLDDPPFYAVACRSALTFPFGGVRVDRSGRALDRDGDPIDGLYAVGADAGGLQGPGYVGGLALGVVFGPLLAEHLFSTLPRKVG